MEGKMMKKRMILFVVFCVMALVATAQTLNVEQQHKMNRDALDMVNRYQIAATMHKPRQFVNMFAKDTIHIYNDLLGLCHTKAKRLTVNEYKELLSTATAPSVRIRNVKKGKMYERYGMQYMEISFEKDIDYTDNCGVLFSAEKYFDCYHDITMTLMWNDNLDNCVIVRLEGEIKSKKEMVVDDRFFVIQNTDERDKNLSVYGKSIGEFNDFSQVIVVRRESSSVDSISYDGDADMKIKVMQQDENCPIYVIKYIPRHWRLKLHGDFGMVSPFGVIGDSRVGLGKSMSYAGGLDVGYVVPSKSKFQFGIFTGIGLSYSKLPFSLGSFSYNYEAPSAADIDGDEYVRYYEFKNVGQTQELLDLTIPVYFDFNIQFNRWVSLYLDLGVKNHINVSAKLSDIEGSYSTWGVYPQYGDLRLDYTTGLEQFVQDKPLSDIVKTENKNTMNKYSLDVMGALGVRVGLSKSVPLYLDLGVGFEYSVMKPYEKPILWNPVIYEGITDINRTFSNYTVDGGEEMRYMLDCVSELRRQMFTINVGLLIKL